MNARGKLIRDYRNELDHFKAKPQDGFVRPDVSFTGKPSTNADQVAYCEAAIEALHNGADVETWNY